MNTLNVKMNLKICEGCGALWLRTELKGGIYCKRCTPMLAELPPSGKRGVRPAPIRRRRAAQTGMTLVGGAR
jgi:hypothetical protein